MESFKEGYFLYSILFVFDIKMECRDFMVMNIIFFILLFIV